MLELEEPEPEPEAPVLEESAPVPVADEPWFIVSLPPVPVPPVEPPMLLESELTDVVESVVLDEL